MENLFVFVKACLGTLGKVRDVRWSSKDCSQAEILSTSFGRYLCFFEAVCGHSNDGIFSQYLPCRSKIYPIYVSPDSR